MVSLLRLRRLETERMKARVCHWKSTVYGIGILALLAYAIHLDRTLLKSPPSFMLLAAGLYGIFVYPPKSK